MSKQQPQPLCEIAAEQKRIADGLAEFRKRHNLSIRQMASACSGDSVISKSSMDRVCNGVSEIRYLDKLKPQIISNLKDFLARKSYSAKEIETELLTIFTKEEISPMQSTRIYLPRDVQKYFGLSSDPFRHEPKTANETFTNKQLNSIAEEIEDAINYQGFLAVLGNIGTGKTVMKNRIIETAQQSNGKMRLFFPRFAQMDKVDAGSIVIYLLECFDQRPAQRLVKSQLRLENFLAHLHEQGIRVALGFDECHRLHPKTLTALKNFMELGTGGFDRYLGIVLFGWKTFENRLLEAEFQEIAERIQIIEMPTIEKCAWDYLKHRFALVSGDIEKLFDKAAVTRLVSQAVTPLTIGNLANAALIKAYTMGESKVSAAFVKDGSEPVARRLHKVS